MAKIFIDTDILPKAFRKLEPGLKIAWYYIWTHCDRSGVWEIDEDLFEFENGCDFNTSKFIEFFAGQVEIFQNKILLKDYININFGTLTPNYNPHKPAFRDMAKNNIKLEPSLNQAYFKLVDEDVDIDEDKEEDVDKGKGGMGEKPKPKPKPVEPKVEIVYPFDTEKFKTHWQLWKAYKAKEHNFKFKSPLSEQGSLNDLSELTTDEATAIAIINQSISKGWKGFFELKNVSNGTGNGNTGQSSYIASDNLKRKIAERLQPD